MSEEHKKIVESYQQAAERASNVGLFDLEQVHARNKNKNTHNQASDYCIWIGGHPYPREKFIEEALRMGVCRRISNVPANLVKGVSRVFLISDITVKEKKIYEDEMRRRDRARYRREGEVDWQKKFAKKFEKLYGRPPTEKEIIKEGGPLTGPMPRGIPVIFGWFIVHGIVYVTTKLTDEEIRQELKERGIEDYDYVEKGFGFSDERLCGSLEIGGTYLLSEEDMKKVKDLTESGLLEGQIEIIDSLIEYDGKRFRGVRSVSRVQGDIWLGLQKTLVSKKHSWSKNDDETSTCRNCDRTVETRKIRKGGLPKCGGSNQKVTKE